MPFNRTTQRAVVFVLAGLFAASPVLANPPSNTTDPRVIMEASARQAAGDRVVARLRMTITDGQGRSRVRDMALRSMEFDGGRKSILRFESPADMRGTGLLSVDHAEGTNDEQWLYLPSLHRATRIAASRRSGSFVGSDFTFADLTARDPDDFNLRMATQNVVVNGQPCWHIEATPRTPAVREETGYERVELWVSKTNLLVLRSKASMGQGRAKYVQLEDVRRIDGVWTAGRIVARTVRNEQLESQTVLERRDVRYGDASVRDTDFTVQSLERGL
jgi:outer membrane lipoprotein-sorting protein